MFPQEKPQLDHMFTNHKWKFLDEYMKKKIQLKNELPKKNKKKKCKMIESSVRRTRAQLRADGPQRPIGGQQQCAAPVAAARLTAWMSRGRRLHYSLPQQAAHTQHLQEI